MQKTILFILLNLILINPVFGASCTEDPTGQDNCEVQAARDQNALGSPAPNYLKLLANNAAAITVPTPAAGQCILGDTAATTATDSFSLLCKDGVTLRAPVTFKDSTGTTVGSMSDTGLITANSMSIPRPYGQYSTTTDQTTGSTTTAYVVSFASVDIQSGLTHPVGGDNSKTQIDSAGTYRIFVSAIGDTNTNGSHLDLWLRVDGANVVGSNTRIQLAASTEMTLAVEFLYTFTAGQYFQIAYHGDHSSIALIDQPLQAANPPIPYTPAVIMVVSKVSS